MYLNNMNSGGIPAEFQKFRVDCGGIPGFQPESVEE